jgi:hypothetical protein
LLTMRMPNSPTNRFRISFFLGGREATEAGGLRERSRSPKSGEWESRN